MADTIFDAVNAALESVTPGAGGSNVSPDKAQNPTADDSASNAHADAEDQGEGDDLELEGDEAAEAVDEGDGTDDEVVGKGEDDARESDDPAGKKPDDKRSDAEKADDKAKDAAKLEPVKKPDALNDPIPKELARETQDRIRTLIKTTKETEAKAAEATKNLDFIVEGVRATGMNPQQYGEVLSFMQLFNSGDPVQQTKALELIENIADNLAGMLGKERAASDPLKGFPDLAQAVQQGQMTRQWASQLATSRRQQQVRANIETSVRTGQQNEAAVAQERETARVDMNNWEIETGAKDPQFAGLKDKLIKELKEDFQKLPPKEWLPRFQQAYRVAKAAAGPARTATGQFVKLPGVSGKGTVPANQPLRARSPAGGGTHAAKSMGEAIDAALASMK